MSTDFEASVERPLKLLLQRELRDARISIPASAPVSVGPKETARKVCSEGPAGGEFLREPGGGFKRILVPTDFSPSSSHALKCAHHLAECLKGELIVVYVALPLKAPRDRSMPENERRWQELHEAAENHLNEQLRDTIGSTTEGSPIRVVFREGSAHEGIVREAVSQAADIVVIARHGHTGDRHLLLGPTAEFVLRNAPCPVLLIDDPAPK